MDQYSTLTRFPSAVPARVRTAVAPVRAVRRIAILGNHLPRHCGIATFTTHLSDAIAETFPSIDCFVLAMNDGDTINLYYGAADTCVALATGSVRQVLRWLDENGTDPNGHC